MEDEYPQQQPQTQDQPTNTPPKQDPPYKTFNAQNPDIRGPKGNAGTPMGKTYVQRMMENVVKVNSQAKNSDLKNETKTSSPGDSKAIETKGDFSISLSIIMSAHIV